MRLERVGRRLAVVTMQHDLHRVGRGPGLEHLARGAVLADGEVGGGQTGHRRVLSVRGR